MPYIRRMKIKINHPANILNEDAQFIMKSWIDSGRIIEFGNDADPEDSLNIIAWVKFDSEADANEYYTAINNVMVSGVDDANFTILEISNEIVTVNANS